MLVFHASMGAEFVSDVAINATFEVVCGSGESRTSSVDRTHQVVGYGVKLPVGTTNSGVGIAPGTFTTFWVLLDRLLLDEC